MSECLQKLEGEGNCVYLCAVCGVCVHVHVCVFKRERESVRVCVCVCEREREIVCV